MALQNKEDKTLLWIAIAGGIAWLLLRKKRKGSIEIGPLDQGEFLPDNYKELESANTGNGTVTIRPTTISQQAFVGPLPVTYGSGAGEQQSLSQVNGFRKRNKMVGKTIIIG